MRTVLLSALALTALLACGDKDSSSDGTDGTDGTDGADGTDGTDGTDGSDGTGGTDGTTNDLDEDGDGYPASEDCDDNNRDINPGEVNICDGIDNDCSGDTDENRVTFYAAGGSVSDVSADFVGDVVLSDDGAYVLCEGTYAVNIDIEADVTISSLYGAEATVLDGGASGTTVSVGAAGDPTWHVQLTGLTLTNGAGDTSTWFSDEAGGGLSCTENRLTVTDTIFTNNTAEEGGGLHSHHCLLSLSNVTMDGNTADYGGDMLIDADQVELEDVRSTNAAAANGAFAYLEHFSGIPTVTMISTSVEDSTAERGTVFMQGYTDAQTSETGMGGGSFLDLYGCSFQNNESGSRGMIYAEDSVFLSSWKSDFGTGTNSNSGDDVELDDHSGLATYTYGQEAWFYCYSSTCLEDFSGRASAEGEFRVTDGETSDGDYACDQNWSVEANNGLWWPDLCDNCVFGFDAEFEYQASASVEDDCSNSFWPSEDIDMGIAYVPSGGGYAYGTIMISYDGSSWMPYWYGSFERNQLTFSYGYSDGLYESGSLTVLD